VGFAVKLHSDLDKVERVSGSAGDYGSYAAFDEAFQTHVLEEERRNGNGVWRSVVRMASIFKGRKKRINNERTFPWSVYAVLSLSDSVSAASVFDASFAQVVVVLCDQSLVVARWV
jgi:hypothetical protein